MTPTGRWCGLLGFCISALLHLGIGAGILWHVGERSTDADNEYPVTLSLAMFQAAPEGETAQDAPVIEAGQVPEPVPPVLVPEPEPEPKPVPVPETEPKPKPKPTPKPKPVSKPIPQPRPAREAPPPRKVTAARSRGPAATSAAKNNKGTPDAKALETRYLGELRRAIAQKRRYPQQARRRGISGTVTLYFVIERNGKLTGVRVDKSSGSSVLDKAAIETLHRIKKFKPIPRALERDRWTLRVPIKFSLE